MRHRNLMADGIRIVASNARQVSCAQSVITEVWKTLMTEVDRHYERGRRLAPTAMRALFESIDGIVMNNLQIVDGRLRETPATPTKPKGAAIDVSYVGVMKKAECEGFDDLYELFTLRIVMKSKVVTFHLHPHPITFQYHAAERLVERVDGQKNPFEMIAGELAEWSLALWEAYRVSKNPDDLRLSLPCMEGKGMLAGQLVKLPVSPMARTTNNKVGRFNNAQGAGKEKLPVFVVKTFVGQDKLRPEQVAALNRLARWKMVNKAEYTKACEASLYDVAFYDEGYVVPELGAKARGELLGILDDQDFKRQMTTKTLEAGEVLSRTVMPSTSAMLTASPARLGWVPPKMPPLGIESRAM